MVAMDRRREPRFRTNQQAEVTVLGRDPVTIGGTTLDMSRRGMRLRLGCPIPVDSPVQVRLSDSFLLGEVCRVEPAGDEFVVALVLEQVLHVNPDLIRLSNALRAGAMPAPAPHCPAD